MRPKSDKLSWEQDGKTVEAPSSYSQQRLKAVQPRMSWGEDASTVARPADAQLPEDAFRPDLVQVSSASEPSALEVPGRVAEPAARQAQPRVAQHPWRRWLLLVLTIPLFYVLSYTAVRVAQKLQHGASAAQLWGAVREVLHETVAELRRAPAEAPPRGEAPSQRSP